MEIIEEQYLIVPAITGDRTATIPKSSSDKRDIIVAEAVKVKKPTNKQELQSSALTLSSLKSIIDGVESSRETSGRPFLDMTRVINTSAKLFLTDVVAEFDRIKGFMKEYSEEELKRERDEQKKLDDNKWRLEQEAAAALVKQNEVAEQPRASVKTQIKVATQVAETQQALAAVENVVVAPAAAKVVGFSAKLATKFEITDAAALYAARPEFFDLVPKNAVMKAAINLKTVLPGLRVWEGVK
jgi:hypothetical protein